MSETFPHLRVIGLTGKIGSGKSTARQWFEKKGIPTLDCDAIVHEIYLAGHAGAIKIQTLFGDDYLTIEGAVDRKKLARRLGGNLKKWEILNRMIHPIVIDQLKRKLKKMEGPIVVIEIQVYEKRHFEKLIDELWVIETNTATRHQRIKKREIGKTFLAAMEEQQAKRLETPARVIRNEGTAEGLIKELEAALNKV
jgi:dephospho-CoA kinase